VAPYCAGRAGRGCLHRDPRKLGEVVYDAIRHGFHPKQQPWIVTDGAYTNHYFADGRPPSTEGFGPPAASMPDAEGDR